MRDCNFARKFARKIEALQQWMAVLQRRASEAPGQPEAPPVEILEELTAAVEELEVAEEELRRQNAELIATQQAVEAARQRYQDLFEFAPDGYLVTDTEGVIREANRAAITLFNAPQQLLVGTPLALFVSMPERQAFRSQLHRLLQTDRAEDWGMRLQPRSGTPVEASLAVATMRDPVGKAVGLRWLLRDITERKRAEEELRQGKEAAEAADRAKSALLSTISHRLRNPLNAVMGYTDLMVNGAFGNLSDEQIDILRRVDSNARQLLELTTTQKQAEEMLQESETRYHTLVENALEGIYRSTPEGRFLEVNPALVCMLGYKSVEEVLALNLPDELYVDPRERECLRARYEATGMLNGVELLWKKKGGELIVVSLYARAIHDAQGNVVCYEGMVLDITERKHMEKALRESEKLAATGRMAAGVAHEINNPLAGIKNSFLLIKDAIPAHHPYYEYVDRIEKEIDRITRIVRQMYNLYQPNQERASEFPIEEIICDVVALVQASCREQGVRIAVKLPQDSLVVYLPQTSLHQVLFNIIRNAIDASPRDGIVTVTTTVNQDHLCITVADQGSGIPEARRTHIFEPFFTTKSDRPNGSLGLGLSVSKSLIEAMGGSLDFDTQVGQGTVFKVIVPRYEPQQGTVRAATG